MKKVIAMIVAVLAMGCGSMSGEELGADALARATAVVRASMPAHMNVGTPKVTNLSIDNSTGVLTAQVNAVYANVPFNRETVNRMSEALMAALSGECRCSEVKWNIDGVPIEQYLVDYDSRYARHHAPFVTYLDENRRYSNGLDGNIIALWQSHGWYFEPKLNRWEWQRARVWQTVEDLYTQSYVLPFLVPMLENAGAYVMLPRERDVSSTEVIVDNDGAYAQNHYAEKGKGWKKGKDAGFAFRREYYVEYDNPFDEGTYRYVSTTTKSKDEKRASWSAQMPQAGTYAVYVSYKTLPQSVGDAVYTINSLAGSTRVMVDQRMGGGTWIYLGHYPLAEGMNRDVVVLSNLSQSKGVVSADAVKIGGGMGNVARRVEAPAPDDKVDYEYRGDVNYSYQLSRYPRFTEAARYFMQWSGVPDSVYTPSHLLNDYTDDYRSRGMWVNWLAGGSEVLPGNKGLGVPVDMAFAFHSDAGTTPDDSIVGTLGIYMTNKFGNYANGTPRIYSRLLTNAVSTNICNAVRAEFEPNWTRRGMWDKSYYEARVPEVPTMLLELLSHHNFADMRYGLDPAFRFTVSRAIYKGMLEFISQRDGRPSQVQPLPVGSFAITHSGGNNFLLSWKAVPDTLVADRALPTSYIVEERIGDGVFRSVAVVHDSRYLATVTDNEVHSYRIVAMNSGGRSFPSEVLACGVAREPRCNALVVNGFTRVSAPDWFMSGRGDGDVCGFNDKKDHGVPWGQDISYIGSQFEFRCNVPWSDDDSSGFGASNGNYETRLVAGNTFDYAAVHGRALLAAGCSFVSASVKAVEEGLSLGEYDVVDFVFGKQKTTVIGSGAVPARYGIFSEALMSAISGYTAGGGNVLVSGSYVASDIWDVKPVSQAKQQFARDVLGYRWRMGQAEASGQFYTVATALPGFAEVRNGNFASQLNDSVYCVESPDGILPSSKNGTTIVKYYDNNMGAGVASDMGNYRSVVLGFPFETIASDDVRRMLMNSIVDYLMQP
ncbi:MAG: xanthan lyase [Muribaculaceae bacterium]